LNENQPRQHNNPHERQARQQKFNKFLGNNGESKYRRSKILGMNFDSHFEVVSC
jgi:hypothetical protein